jgi:hypothetical protein
MSRTIKAIEHQIMSRTSPEVVQPFAPGSSPNGSNAAQKHFLDTHFESCAWPSRHRSR